MDSLTSNDPKGSQGHESFNPYHWLESRIKFGVKAGLDNIQKLMSQLGHPHKRYPCVLIAGTNGKGYTTSLLSKLLSGSKMKVGWFISPHMVNVRERIRINSEVISSDEFHSISQEVSDKSKDQEVSYFEALTAVASLYFQRQGVDIALFEVGLGGRLDSTNVHDANYSIITSIGLDHVEYLGADLQGILLEKAGVFRSDQHSWVQLTQLSLRTKVQLLAREKKTRLHLQELTHLGQAQGHFYRNQYLAEAAAKKICDDLGFAIPRHLWADTIQSHDWDGRIQQVDDHVWSQYFAEVYLDGAHNPESFTELLNFSKAKLSPGVIVVGLMQDKSHREIFNILEAFITLGWELKFTHGSFPRFANSSELKATFGGESQIISLDRLIEGDIESSSSSLIICGSLYLMGEVIQQICGRCPQFAWYRQFESSSNEMVAMLK